MKYSDISFGTDSYLLASYLLSQSCILLDLDRTNPRRVVFIFQEEPKRITLTEKFLSHKATVEPHKFQSAQKDLKQLLYQT